MEEVRKNVSEWIGLADAFIKEMHVKDLAILKICLLSFGMVLGILVPKKWKRPVIYTSLFVFLITYLPLVTKWGAYLGKSYCQLKRSAEI